MNTLGSNMTADNYFPLGSSTIHLGDKIDWHIVISNQYDDAELISVRLKLLNHSDSGPNDSLQVPSSSPQVFEINQLIANNSTIALPLQWSVTDFVEDDNATIIRGLRINGFEADGLDVRNANGENYRIVIELWKYDPELNDFIFSWSTGAKERSVWNEIWFNLN
jgi:hypothetical protein